MVQSNYGSFAAKIYRPQDVSPTKNRRRRRKRTDVELRRLRKGKENTTSLRRLSVVNSYQSFFSLSSIFSVCFSSPLKPPGYGRNVLERSKTSKGPNVLISFICTSCYDLLQLAPMRMPKLDPRRTETPDLPETKFIAVYCTSVGRFFLQIRLSAVGFSANTRSNEG